MSTEASKPNKKMKSNMKMKAGELPLSLIEANILPRMPAKFVGRFKCVCKQWKLFLSTPMFARMHLNHVTIKDRKLLILDCRTQVIFRTNPLNDYLTTIRCNTKQSPDPSVYFIIGSLDGMVCLALREATKYKLAFWNPLTGAYKKLSSSPRFEFTHDHFARDVIGFYIDHSGDYKLVCLIWGGLCGAYIYSNRLDIWREIEFSFRTNGPCRWSSATLWCQCLYFTVIYFPGADHMFESYTCIICFDTKTETFRKIRFPLVPCDATDYCGSLVILNGSLLMCVSYKTVNTSYEYLKHGDMWRMDGDDGWVKVAAFNGPLLSSCNEFIRQHICTASTGNWLAVSEEGTLFKKMNTEDFMKQYWCFCSPGWVSRSRMIYVETLVSPNP